METEQPTRVFVGGRRWGKRELLRRAGAIGIVPVTPAKPRIPTLDEQIQAAADEAVARAVLGAARRGVILTDEEKAKARRDAERMMRQALRTSTGLSREQKRRLKQIRAGTLKGPVVSVEARYTATGIHPASDLSIVAQPGEVLGK